MLSFVVTKSLRFRASQTFQCIHYSVHTLFSHPNLCAFWQIANLVLWLMGNYVGGIFSASPRVYTFLSIVCRYQLSVRHVSGSAILPSDFASRNPPDCNEPTCQVCSFIYRTMNCVVMNVSAQDLITGKARLPFTSRSASLAIQAELSDLRRTRAHMLQSTRPSN